MQGNWDMILVCIIFFGGWAAYEFMSYIIRRYHP